MRARTKAGLVTRLERLECRVAASGHTVKLRFGHLKWLPRQYQGERHSIVARELPKQGDQEWVEFEEVPGRDPDPPEQLARRGSTAPRCHVRGPYPGTEEDLEALGNQPAHASKGR